MRQVLFSLFVIATSCLFGRGFLFADETAKQLGGSWKLTSWIIEVIGERATEPLGPNPKGRMVITPEWLYVCDHRCSKSQARGK